MQIRTKIEKGIYKVVNSKLKNNPKPFYSVGIYRQGETFHKQCRTLKEAKEIKSQLTLVKESKYKIHINNISKLNMNEFYTMKAVLTSGNLHTLIQKSFKKSKMKFHTSQRASNLFYILRIK